MLSPRVKLPVDVVESTAAPCPTAVLVSDEYFAEASDDALARSIAQAVQADLSPKVTKIGLVAPTATAVGGHHAFDFVQIRGQVSGECGIERGGNCGNSMLAAGCALLRRGPDERRVELVHRTTGVRAEIRVASPGTFDVTLEHAASDVILGPGARWRAPGDLDVTTVDFVNPYVFVAGEALGIDAARLLAATGRSAPLARASELRKTVAHVLELPRGCEFTKLGVVAVGANDVPVVRTVYLDRWHPALALTGAASFAVARGIDGSVVHRLAGRPARDGALSLQTPRERVRLELRTTGDALAVTVFGRRVVFHGRRTLAA